MQAVKEHLALVKGRLRPFRSVSLRLSTGDETIVAPALARLSSAFEGSVGIGSYPASIHHPSQKKAFMRCCLPEWTCMSLPALRVTEMRHNKVHAAQVKGREHGTNMILSLERKSSAQLDASQHRSNLS